jgi:hypothetical protein
VKEEMKQESNNNGGEEVVLSVKKQEQEQEQEVKTTVVVDSTEDGVGVNKENADADVYEKVNAYLKTRIAKSDGNDSNSHYK